MSRRLATVLAAAALLCLGQPATARQLVRANHDDVQACRPLSGGRLLLGTTGGLLLVGAGDRPERLWTRLDGLPGTRVHALLQEGNTVWIGTEEGLARLDLARLRLERVALTRAESGSHAGERSGAHPWARAVRAITRHRGQLYLGTWGGGLLRLEGSTPVPVASNAGPADITSLASIDSTLYAGTAGAGLWQVSGAISGAVSRAGLRPSPAQLPSPFVWSLAAKREAGGQTLYVGTLAGLVRLQGAAVELLSSADVRAILAAERAIDPVLVGTYGDGVRQLRRGRVTPAVGFGSALAAGFVNAIGRAHDATCIGTRAGAWLAVGDTAPRRVRPAGPPSNDISALAADGDRLYVGTFDAGLAVLARGAAEPPWRAERSAQHEAARGAAEPPWRAERSAQHEAARGAWRQISAVDRRIDALAVQHQGQLHTLWVGTSRGLYRVRGSGVKRFGTADGLRDQHVHCLTVLHDGSLLAGTARGVVIVRGEQVEAITVKQGLPVAAVWSAAEDRDGGLWLGTTRGLYHWSRPRQRYTRYSVSSGHLNDDWVTAVTLNRDAVYVGTYNAGVSRLTRAADGTWTTAHLGGGWVNFNGLQVVGRTLYAASMSGLHQLPLNGGTRFLSVAGAAPGLDVTAVVSRPDGGLWVASRRGLALHGPGTPTAAR